MPELPEVETIKNQLLKKIKGKTIKKIRLLDYKKNFQGNPRNLLSKLVQIRRRAKLLIFNLANGFSFIIHLKLTGQLIYYSSPPKNRDRKTRVIFYFKDGSVLFFNDSRKFGFLKIMKTEEVSSYLHKEKYGPEPLEITCFEFETLLKKRPKALIKPLLMEQTFIAGLGNIYTQEACFRAKLLPQRRVSSLKKNEIKRLFSAIQTLLKEALQHQGTSFDTTYRTPENQPGGFGPYLKVYHQKKCGRCQTELKTLNLGGRKTFYCKKCQK